MDTRRLVSLGARRQRLRVSTRETLDAIAAEVVRLSGHLPQHRIAELAGLTREQVRRIQRAAGIGPDGPD